ncbi:Uri superfamily endonuclease [Methanomicrobium sp. W14]|uniref:GIY-YIG nuclease family protein n=1 Tax=Methanomicrobium sp. W14 TaxID=2817839 RepID=UPI001AE9F285|nr:GIY-YIG nuclease family protein [Methanomicrobium sp. W14]MBP2133506.1 Uri superfamily endonuclease [Methanomicrobium sp. W14]
MAEKGIYFIVFRNREACIKVGALGNIGFKEGWHIYAGSALGSGGLSRVERHFSLAERKDRKPHWHIDYLLLSEKFRPVYAVYAPTKERFECQAAGMMAKGKSVENFGCTDCMCRSHLFYRENDPHDELTGIFRSLGLSPSTATPQFKL